MNQSPTLWRDQHGGVFEIDPSEAAKAEKAGWVPATQVDVQAAMARQAAGSAGGMAKTAAEGLASGAYDALTAIPRLASAAGSAALGTEDPFAEATGRNALEALRYAGGRATGETHEEANAASYAYGDQQRLRAQVNPGTAMGSSIGGQIAGSAGLGALGGLAGEAATGALTAEGAQAGLGARLAGAVARGATEGAALNAVAAQDEAYLENRKLTGEQVLAQAGLGALLGGGLSFATSGAGELFGAAKGAVSDLVGGAAEKAEKPNALSKVFDREPTAGDYERLAEKQFGEAAPGIGERAQKLFSKASSAVSGADQEAVDRLTALGPEGKAARRLALEGDALRETATRDLTGHVDAMADATRNLTDDWRGAAKVENVAKTIRKGEQAFNEQFQVALDQTTAVSKRVNEMLADPTAYGRVAPLREIKRAADLAGREIASAVESGSHEGMLLALDNLKKRLGPLAKPGRELAVSSADTATTEAVREMYEGLRTSLENEAVWGKAGAMQKEVNAAMTKWLSTKSLFERQFMTEVGRDAQSPWLTAKAADPGKVGGYVNGLTNTKNDIAHRIVTEHMGATENLADTLARAGELTPEKAAELKRVTEAANGFRKTIEGAEKQLVAANQLRALEEVGGGGSRAGFATVGAMLGGAPGAALGGLADAAYGALRNPARVVRQMSALEKLAEKAQSKMGGQLDAFFDGMKASAEKAMPITAKVVARTVNAAKDAALPAALEAFQGKHAKLEDAYHARVQELARANDNFGGLIRDNAVKGFGDLVHHESTAVSQAVITATNAVNYLQSKLPETASFNPNSLTPMTSRPTPSRAEIMQFAPIWQAVDKPLSVLRDLNSGTVTRDQVDAIHAVYPRLYDWIRGETMRRLRDMDQRGEEVPIRQRLLLDTLLDLDGAGEPAFSPTFAAKYADGMKDAPAQQQQGPAPGGRPGPSKVASRYATGTSAMLGGAMS